VRNGTSPLRKKTPLGLRLIAALLFVNSAILISFSLVCFSLPEQEARRFQEFLNSLAYFRKFSFDLDPWTAFVDLVLGLWGVLKAIGIWRMWRWVRILIIIDLGLWVANLVMFSTLSDRANLAQFFSKPEFLINLVINLLVLIYLVDPSVKEAYDRDRPSV
jgi:hypothetical protein